MKGRPGGIRDDGFFRLACRLLCVRGVNPIAQTPSSKAKVAALAQALPAPGERIVRCTDASGFGPDVLGGKGAQLAELARMGLPVPPWFCVTTLACDELLAGKRLSPAARAALLAEFDALFPSGARVAVRSSAEAEDSGKDSFAGQLDTFLFVTRDELVDRVLACVASAGSDRVALYRARRGHQRPMRMAVVVQQMIDSEMSGVLFTANPTTGDRTEAVIAAGFGLGEGIVTGRVDCDTYFADLATGVLRREEVLPKHTRIAFDRIAERGTVLEEVDSARAAARALCDEQLSALVEVGRHVEAVRGTPQDIEWAFDGAGNLFVLQARAITTLRSAVQGRETIFDNANIVESYPGVSSPLTFSFVRPAYEKTLRGAARLFGIPEPLIAENADLFENLVGLVDGRIYYNILNWYRLYQLVPGFESALPAWEKALGLSPRNVRRAPATAKGLAMLSVKARMVLRVIEHQRSLPRTVEAFLRGLDELQRGYRRLDLATQDAHELIELIERLGRALYEPYAIAMVNDFFAQQLYELAGKLIARWGLGDPASLRNELLCGERGMDSVAPVRSAVRLAEQIRLDAALRGAFESPAADVEVWERLHREPRFAPFCAALAAHLEAYGDRTLHELKMETPSLEENPAFVVAMLRNFLRGGQNVDQMEQREREIRTGAEAKVEAQLRWHPLRRRLFGFVLDRARRSVKFRENLRLARTRAYGMMKRIYRELGKRLAAVRLIDAAEDIAFLTVEEVNGAVRGHGVTRSLSELVQLRRREYASYAAARPAPRVVTRGMVAANTVARAAPVAPPAGEHVLQGVGCSQGKVSGKAKVIVDPHGDLDIRGEILVAPMTDPGWVFLMVASAGIISERGTILSHTAIIGRELGIPTVVGVKDATQLISTGDSLELDGGAGTVKLSARERGSES